MKKHIVTLLIILGVSPLFSKNGAVFLQQVEYENIYKNKVTSFLDKFLPDDADYYVFADIQLKLKSETSSTTPSDNGITSNNKDKSDDLTFFLGLKPDSEPDLSGITPGPNNRTSNSSGGDFDSNDYEIDEFRLSVYLSESVYSVKAVETITNFANDNITEIRNCFDCFTIASMPNPSGTDNILTDERFKQLQDAYDEQAQDIKSVLVSYEALKDSIQWSVFEEKQGALKAALQDMIEQSEEDKKDLESQLEAALGIKTKEIEFLERQLDDANGTREFLEDQEARRNELANNIDSLRFVSLMDIEQEYRAKQNQLLDDISLDYERSVQARLDQAEATEERLFKLVESGGVPPTSKTTAPPQKSSNSTNIILYVIIGVVAVGFIALLIILLTRKKKVVYLKPKDSEKEITTGGDKNNQSAPAPEVEFTAPPTDSNENTDVVRAETRSLRQSAVTMSAGQKEGASQIISDWLDESSDETNDDNNDDNNSE